MLGVGQSLQERATRMKPQQSSKQNRRSRDDVVALVVECVVAV